MSFQIIRLTICILLLLLYCSHGPLRAEPFFKSLERWSAVNEIEAEIHVLGITGFAPQEQFVMDVLMRQSADTGKFFRATRISRFGQLSFDTTTSYDGEVYGCLDKSGASALLTVSKQLPEQIPNFLISFFPFDVFRFLRMKGGNQFVELTDLINPENLRHLIKPQESSTYESFADLNATLISVPASLGSEGDRGTFKVYFSDDSFSRVLGWRHYLPNGALLSEVRILGWDEFSIKDSERKVLFPTGFDWVFYKSDSRNGTPEIAFSYNATFKSLRLFSQKGQLEFTIDPSLADYVDDLDTGTLIKVPR